MGGAPGGAVDNIFKPDELNAQLLTFLEAQVLTNLSTPELHRLLMNDIVHAFKFHPRQRGSFAPAEYRQLWPYEIEAMQPADLQDLFFSKGELQELNPGDEEDELPPEPPAPKREDSLQLSFFKSGAGWLIGARGKELTFTDLRGFHFLHYLLRRKEELISAHELYHIGCPPAEELEHITAVGVGEQIAEACRKKVQKALKTAVALMREEFGKGDRTRWLIPYFNLEDGGTIKTGFDCCYRPPDGQPKPKFMLYA